MIKINQKMEQMMILQFFSDVDIIMKKVEEFSKDVFPKIKLVDNQLVVVDYYNRLEDNALDYEWIKSTYKDFTGYEASCNRMRLSDYICIDEILILPFVINLLERLERVLRECYPQFKFTITVQFWERDAEIRFNVTRENESGWLLDDLDQYNEDAILVCTI